MLRGVVSGGARSRVAVIDIGSNSVRLVVYDGLGRAPHALVNDKVMCGLGRGLATSGRLNPEAIEVALVNLQRFAALARAIGVGRLDVLATAAVRDAEDGLAFVREVERRCGLRVGIVAGEAEGRLSAYGVLAGIPDAHGVVGDLGGGSVELVTLIEGRLGASTTLPIGPLRLLHLTDSEKKLRETIDGALTAVPQLRDGRGRDFYLVGGSWRALARIHMEQTGYPLHIIHNYVIPRGEAENFLGVVGRLSRKSLEKMTSVSKKRLEAVPLAAFVLARILRQVEPRSLVFSAFGLREGHLYDLLSPSERQQDPLLVACAGIAAACRRFDLASPLLAEWTAPLFPKEAPRWTRLRAAASLLSDTGWSSHPDYRAEEAFLNALRLPYGGLDHAERVWLATALHARYGGAADARVAEPTRRLLSADDTAIARSVGLALRLAYTMSGGAAHLLQQTALALADGTVQLIVPESERIFLGESVQRRLETLAKALGRKPALVAASPPPPARGAARG